MPITTRVKIEEIIKTITTRVKIAGVMMGPEGLQGQGQFL